MRLFLMWKKKPVFWRYYIGKKKYQKWFQKYTSIHASFLQKKLELWLVFWHQGPKRTSRKNDSSQKIGQKSQHTILFSKFMLDIIGEYGPKKCQKSGRFYGVKWVLTFLADFSWRIIFSTGSFWTLVSKSKLKIWFFLLKNGLYTCVI